MKAGIATLKRCATLALLVTVVSTGTWRSASALRAQAPQNRYLVIPFENSTQDSRLYWLSEGSAVLLTDDLLALGAQALTRDDRLRAFERLTVPPVASLSHATVIRLGQLVGASHVIVGSFDGQGDALTVRSRVLRLDTGRLEPEVVERGPLAQMFDIYARVARAFVESAVDLEKMEQGHPPAPAFEQYIKGLLAVAPATKLNYLDEALEIYPNFQRARLAQWEVYTEQGEHRRALDIAREVPADHPQARRARFRAGVSLMNLERFDEAFTALDDLRREAPHPAVLNNLGIVQMRRKPGAPGGTPASFFEAASKLDPEDPDIVFNLDYACFRAGDPKAASHWLREAVRRNPADDEAHFALGVALQASGSAAEGAREKELARQLSSDWVDIEKTVGAGLPPELERLKIEMVPPGTLNVESVLVASEQKEQQELSAFHLERGRRLSDQERDGEAIAELRRAIYLTPYQSEAHLLLARLYERGGRVKEAVDALKIAVWIDPGNAEAKAHLERLTR